jgi:hypothetical protein
MARPWRDVISEQGWRLGVMENQKATAASAANRGNVAKLRAVFTDRYASPTAFLAYIGEKLHQYHRLAKTRLDVLDARIKALNELSALAMEFLKTFKVGLDVASKRNADNSKNAHRDTYDSGRPTDETIERNVLTLARRAPRKAEYLRQLKAYYSVGGGGYAFRNPTALLKYVEAKQEKSGGLVGLSPGVRMEQLDFAHRGDFETEDPNSFSCGAAFAQWSKDPHRGNTPFFLWLEEHPVCLHDDKGRLETRSVAYVHADQRSGAPARSRLKVLIVQPTIMAMDLAQPGAATSICDTTSYQAERRKDPRGDAGWGQGVAAFVWSKDGELFIANHAAQEFHHSSFVSGDKVRCAGMIVVEHGKVTAISNNSGHYKPRKEQVRNFVWLLQGAGALDANAALEVHLGDKKCFTGNPAKFLADYARI